MNTHEVDTAIAILTRQGYPDLAFRLAVLSESERSSRKDELDAETQQKITAQDRDNRRRRMELAMVILDESRTDVDLDDVSDAIHGTQDRAVCELHSIGFDYCRHVGCPNGANAGGNGFCGVHFCEGQPVAIDDISKPTDLLNHPGPHPQIVTDSLQTPTEIYKRCDATTVCVNFGHNGIRPECEGHFQCDLDHGHEGLHRSTIHEW